MVTEKLERYPTEKQIKTWWKTHEFEVEFDISAKTRAFVVGIDWTVVKDKSVSIYLNVPYFVYLEPPVRYVDNLSLNAIALMERVFWKKERLFEKAKKLKLYLTVQKHDKEGGKLFHEHDISEFVRNKKKVTGWEKVFKHLFH